ncbi:MAG: hypothetical protein PHG79_06085 [Methanosarcina sp.]|nr:hypothetical protein [Methanosarcina sp.]MDD4522782.1 hypothetical protein [Methanosarcina sp.]
MTLPEICPLDESQVCKGRECHLFCLEWRTKEPTCLIGYSATSKIKSGKADRKRDTYAEETFRKLGRQPLSKRKNVSEKGDWIPKRLTERPPVRSPERPVEKKERSFTQKNVSEKGDWIPKRLTERPQIRSPERSIERKERNFTQSRDFQEATVIIPGSQPERNYDERLRESHDERLRESHDERLRESHDERLRESHDERLRESHDERLKERYVASDAEKASIRLEPRLKKEAIEQNSVIYAKIQPKIQEKPRTPERVISRDRHTTIFTAFDADKKDNSCLSGREEKTKGASQNREKRKKLEDVMEIDLPDTYDEFWS